MDIEKIDVVCVFWSQKDRFEFIEYTLSHTMNEFNYRNALVYYH